MNLVTGLLRLEGAVIFAAATWVFFAGPGGPWWLFVLALLAPDLSMVGYLRSLRLGAWTYNLVHNLALAIGLIVAGFVVQFEPAALAGLILAAHVGMDRALGYGLKFPTAFKDTHLQRLEAPPAMRAEAR